MRLGFHINLHAVPKLRSGASLATRPSLLFVRPACLPASRPTRPLSTNAIRSCAPIRQPPPLRTLGVPDDDKPMQLALVLAREAYAAGEVPIGAVLVDDDGDVISTGRNRVEGLCDATAHAEMEALRKVGAKNEVEAVTNAAQANGSWRRSGCTLYSTVEPCAMCCAAASLCRVKRIVYGAPDLRLGACGTWIDLPSQPHPFHMLTEVTSGVRGDEAADLLRKFFRERRIEAKPVGR
jgi:tRNA(adenine34) deaminase